MRKILSLTLAVVMLLSLAACGAKEEPTLPPIDLPVVEVPSPQPAEPDVPADTEEGTLDGGADIEIETEEVVEELPAETEAPVVEETPEAEAPIEVVATGDWKDFVFTLNGNTYPLPIPYKDFKEATGLTAKDTEEKSWLEPGYYTYCTLKTADGTSVAVVDILNTSEEDAEIINCTIINISQYDTHVEKCGMPVEIAGFKVGDVTSKEALFEKFGEPTKIRENRADEDDDPTWVKYDNDTYRWCMDPNWTTDNCFEIVMNVNTGIIEDIYLDNTPN